MPKLMTYKYSDEAGKECDIRTYEKYEKFYIEVRSHGRTDIPDDYAGTTFEFERVQLRNRFINKNLRYNGYKAPNLYHKSKGGRTIDHADKILENQRKVYEKRQNLKKTS